MKMLKHISAVVALMLLAGGAAFAQQVRTDYDHSAVFERYHTYYWAKVKTSNPLWEQRLEDAVDKDLQTKGWQKVDGPNADVALTAVGGTQNQQEYTTFYNGMGGWRWRGLDEAQTTVTNYEVGSLVVDMYDNQSKRLLWRGVATETLSSKPEKNEHKLQEAVEKMFDHFPPKGK